MKFLSIGEKLFSLGTIYLLPQLGLGAVTTVIRVQYLLKELRSHSKLLLIAISLKSLG